MVPDKYRERSQAEIINCLIATMSSVVLSAEGHATFEQCFICDQAPEWPTVLTRAMTIYTILPGALVQGVPGMSPIRSTGPSSPTGKVITEPSRYLNVITSFAHTHLPICVVLSRRFLSPHQCYVSGCVFFPLLRMSPPGIVPSTSGGTIKPEVNIHSVM